MSTRTAVMTGCLVTGIIAGIATGNRHDPEASEQREPSGRYARPTDAQLKDRLPPLAYQVTQTGATEPPFDNRYWNEEREGLYVDVVTGEPLFSSADKYDAGTGWPSFTRPVDESALTTRPDHRLLWPRIEVRSRYGNSHLGHVFNDGPAPSGLRYCINSAALRFVPRSRLDAEGYGEYRALFGTDDRKNR
ncbi:MAG: peptide-methionine (R)-S-oxide reductase MsrB [Pseudomonadales bacterium]